MYIIAHRGASFTAPENTISAFQQAWNEDADGIELDIHLTFDKKIVVIHDTTTTRTSNLSLTVKETSFKTLRTADVGSWKDIQFKNERIPLLETVLNQIPSKKNIHIEIKSDLSILNELKTLILKFPQLKPSIVFISFSYPLITQLKTELPNYQCLWIVEFGYNVSAFSPSVSKEVIDEVKLARLDGISSCANIQHCQYLSPYIKENSFLWNVWTVDKPATALKMKAYGVHSLSTNKPAYIRKNI